MRVLQSQLYLGLVAMCGFVLFDTQLIVEKRRAGSRDFVTHALDLFIDFIGIFRRLLVILTQKVSYVLCSTIVSASILYGELILFQHAHVVIPCLTNVRFVSCHKQFTNELVVSRRSRSAAASATRRDVTPPPHLCNTHYLPYYTGVKDVIGMLCNCLIL